MIVLVGLLLQALMTRMKGGGNAHSSEDGAGAAVVVIAPQDIIRRVARQSHAAGVRLGEFRDVMSNMLVGNAHELALMETVNRMLRSDLVALHASKISRMVSAHRLAAIPTLP